MQIAKWIFISRPRFWLYTTGPFLIGVLAGIESLLMINTAFFWLNLLYFLFFANALIYGINDYFDADTDRINPKKKHKEPIFEQKTASSYKKFLYLFSAISCIYILYEPYVLNKALLAIFVFLAIAYSAPPFRFKTKPFLDFSSNFFYALPGIIGFAHYTQTLPPLLLLISAFCWTSAMHLFSAIVDIEPDTRSQMQTTAVLLGEKKSLVLCFIFWSFTSLLVYISTHASVAYVLLLYPMIMIITLIHKKISLKKIYWYFPYINAGIGMYITITLLYSLLK